MSRFGEDQILKIVDESRRIRNLVGKDIIKEGDNGDNFYIVRREIWLCTSAVTMARAASRCRAGPRDKLWAKLRSCTTAREKGHRAVRPRGRALGHRPLHV